MKPLTRSVYFSNSMPAPLTNRHGAPLFEAARHVFHRRIWVLSTDRTSPYFFKGQWLRQVRGGTVALVGERIRWRVCDRRIGGRRRRPRFLRLWRLGGRITVLWTTLSRLSARIALLPTRITLLAAGVSLLWTGFLLT